jgi:hypothetical protein
MLAAHRAGGRTDCISFAKAWDRYAFRGVQAKKRRARRATERELLVLKTQLEASLLSEEAPVGELADAIAEHRRLRAQRRDQLARASRDVAAAPERTATPRPGDPDRSRELRRRPGWAWLRVMRRYDEYERALAHLRELEREPVRERETVSPG